MGIKEIEIFGRTLIIHENDEANDSSTGRALTGSWLWDSALHLAQWIHSQVPSNFDLTDKIVLELGAGTGVPGLTAAMLGAARVVLTDIGPILPGLRKNVQADGMEDRVQVRELVWGEGDEGEVEGLEVDVVLMSDVFYDADEMGPLARTMKAVCRERTRVWAASEVRASTGECLDVIQSHGFVAEEVDVSERKLVGRDESSLFAVFEIRR